MSVRVHHFMDEDYFVHLSETLRDLKWQMTTFMAERL